MGHGYSLERYGYIHYGRRAPTRDWTNPRSNEGNDIRDPDKEDDQTVIKLISLDMKIQENAEEHFTSKYDITDPKSGLKEDELKLVVRRGQHFTIGIVFNKPFDREKDDIRFVFEYGTNPVPKNDTHIEIVLSDKDEPKSWGAYIKSQNEEILNVRMTTPPSLLVGKWTLYVDVIKKNDGENRTIYRKEKEKKDIYILFNPWCKDDEVYMEDKDLLEEYVLHETGNIYRGTSKPGCQKPKPWNFAQFDVPVLDCALYLLGRDRHGLKDKYRGCPRLTVRKLSALVNSSDDNGILVGNWSGDYKGGDRPTKWDGSFNIIKQYYKNKQPVKFGQCWVFSGVLTTMCRTLGIPARCTSNFSSAHDTDGSVTIDIYYKDGEKYGGDSIWNFHVWNDVWMCRPDLPEGYGGWQIIDATPQEKSGGVFQCGPASLKAIKEGIVDLPYDGRFIFAEVNADKIIYNINDYGKIEKVRTVRNSVGKKISTNDPKTNWREDITNQYKFEEGSKQEARSVITAIRMGSSTDPAYEPDKPVEIEVALSVEPEEPLYGKDFDFVVTVKNNSSEEKPIVLFINAKTDTYNGVCHKLVQSEKHEINLEAGQSKDLKMDISFDKYYPKLIDHCMLKLSAFCKIKNTVQMTEEEDVIELVKPTLDIQVKEEVLLGESVTVDVSFTNPLPIKLTNCELHLETPRLGEPQTRSESDVNANGTFKSSFKVVVNKGGKHDLIASFNADELFEVNGMAFVTGKMFSIEEN